MAPINPRDFRSDVYIFYGPTRTGKSRAARQSVGDLSIYYQTRSPWWHNYQQEEVVLLWMDTLGRIIKDLRQVS